MEKKHNPDLEGSIGDLTFVDSALSMTPPVQKMTPPEPVIQTNQVIVPPVVPLIQPMAVAQTISMAPVFATSDLAQNDMPKIVIPQNSEKITVPISPTPLTFVAPEAPVVPIITTTPKIVTQPAIQVASAAISPTPVPVQVQSNPIPVPVKMVPVNNIAIAPVRTSIAQIQSSAPKSSFGKKFILVTFFFGLLIGGGYFAYSVPQVQARMQPLITSVLDLKNNIMSSALIKTTDITNSTVNKLEEDTVSEGLKKEFLDKKVGISREEAPKKIVSKTKKVESALPAAVQAILDQQKKSKQVEKPQTSIFESQDSGQPVPSAGVRRGN